MYKKEMSMQAAGVREEENRRLASEIQKKTAAGQSVHAEETELFRRNRGLILRLARKYQELCGHSLGMDDLVNSGSIGLMRAARSYDPNRGVRFSTYAGEWIRDSILKEIYHSGFSIRVSNHQLERIMKVLAIKKRRELEHLEGEDLLSAISEDSGFGRREVERCLRLEQDVLRQTSLNTRIGTEENAAELGDMAVSPDNVERQVLDEQQIRELYASLGKLREEERSTLILRYGLFDGRRHTLKEIAERSHVSPEAVRQREQRAIQAIRNELS